MPDLALIDDDETVQTWFKGWEQQWGETISDHERGFKLNALRRFCELVAKTPDQIVQECLLVRGGSKRISVKGRRLYAERIQEFQDRDGLSAGNTVRSFLIYNGIMLQTGAIRN
jgi:hypothetical protein